MTYAAVVLPVPVSRSYIYEVPETLAARVVPGARVVVPLRRRSVVGIVTEVISQLPSADIAIKPIAAAPDDEPAISSALLERERRFKRAAKRRVVYETVEALGGSAPVSHLVKQLKLSTSALEGLVKQGLARIEHVPEIRDPFAGLSSPPPPSLTEDQRRVV